MLRTMAVCSYLCRQHCCLRGGEQTKNMYCFKDASTTISNTLHVIKAEADRWIVAGAMGLQELVMVH